MQVDQFESEVESLSVQTRKKKGDKEVSVCSHLWFIHYFLLYSPLRFFFSQPSPSSVYSWHRSLGQPALALQPFSLLFYLPLCYRGQIVCAPFIFCLYPDKGNSPDFLLLAFVSSPSGISFIEKPVDDSADIAKSMKTFRFHVWVYSSCWRKYFCYVTKCLQPTLLASHLVVSTNFSPWTFHKWDPEEFIFICILCG